MKSHQLTKLANDIRIETLKMAHEGRSSHIASIFSMAEILAVLYGGVLRFDSKNPSWVERDRFILSKGHGGAGVYAALALTGFFDRSLLATHCQDGSILSGHVSHKNVPGVEFSTGSLGHGLSVACGMAYSAKKLRQNHRIFVLLGDGECNEGSIWEAVIFAAHHNLSNLTAIVDANGMQSLCKTIETLNMEPLESRWQVFGWKTSELDGHSVDDLYSSLTNPHPSKPSCVVARTIKGKGVSFMEGDILWHYKPPQGNIFDQAMDELASIEKGIVDA